MACKESRPDGIHTNTEMTNPISGEGFDKGD